MYNKYRRMWIRASAVVVLAASSLQAQTVSQFDLPTQSLAASLKAIGSQTGTNVLFDPPLVEGLKAPSLKAELTVKAAFERLLAGTKLKCRFIDEKTVTVITEAEWKLINSKSATPQSMSSQSGAAVEQLLAVASSDEQLSAARLAQLGAAEENALEKGKSKDRKAKSADGVEEMIVQESKLKPYNDANLDLPRTTNDPQPYYIFDSETIKRSAATNIEEFLKQRLTMNASSTMNSQRVGSTLDNTDRGGLFANAGNTSEINLRGLGADKTLILINGRRRANVVVAATGSGYTTSSQPDLNGIPIDAIERIEVLPTSASAIYGGGAIGGVINVILKRDYVGGSVRVSYDNVADKDAPNRSMSASYGVALGKTQISFNASWSDSQPLLFQDRRELYDRGLQTLLRNDPGAIYTSTNPFLGSLPNITSTSDFDSAIYNSVLAATGNFTTAYNAAYTPDPRTLTLKNGTPLGSPNTHIAATVLVAGWLTTNHIWGWKEFATHIGEQRVLELQDGSVVHLNTKSVLKVRMTDRGRDLQLMEGEALFIVQRDTRRPFKVRVDDSVIQALGTQFNVHRRLQDTKVSVLEGAIRISNEGREKNAVSPSNATSSAPIASASLNAGEEARIEADGRIQFERTPDIVNAAAWRQRRLVFRDDRLSDVIAEFNRYNLSPKIRLEGLDGTTRHYTGTFNSDDPEAFAVVLSEEKYLSVEREDNEIVIRPRHPQ